VANKIDILDHLSNKGIAAEIGKFKTKLTAREKAKVVAVAARKQLKRMEPASYVLRKSDWITEEPSGSCLLSLRYKNQLIPLEGRETKIRLANRIDALKALRQLATDLEEGLLDNLLENVRERQRKHRGGNVGF